MRKKDPISEILKQAWENPPAKVAAIELHKIGVTSSSLWEWHKTEPARFIDDVWYNNTFNEMRDREILGGGTTR